MKKMTLMLTLLLVGCLVCVAQVKVKTGSLSVLDGEKQIGVSLDLTTTVYKKDEPLDAFLIIDNRAKDWEKLSLDCFVASFNKIAARVGLKSVSDSTAGKYNLVIAPTNVRHNGSLKGIAYLKEVGSADQPKIIMDFSTDDGDDDDEITFRDPLRELGESMAKLFVKQIKQARKQ